MACMAIFTWLQGRVSLPVVESPLGGICMSRAPGVTPRRYNLLGHCLGPAGGLVLGAPAACG